MRKILLIFLLFFILGVAVTAESQTFQSSKVVYIEAFQFGYRVVAIQEGDKIYRTDTLRLNAGDTVTFHVVTKDVTHGFSIDGITDSIAEKLLVIPGRTLVVGPITFNEPGKYRIRCSVNCGSLHPFMSMDIVVEPNIPYYALSGFVVMIGVAALFYNGKGGDVRELHIKSRLLKSRTLIFILTTLNLSVFLLIILTGLFGSVVGSENFSIAVTWILWFALVEFAILFAARAWCSICPIPIIGEWIYRRRILGVRTVKPKPGNFPVKYRNMWIPAIGFLVLSLFIPWIVTKPLVTALLFLSLLVAATAFYITNPPRYFCKHICPASGYIGYHSNASLLALRSVDRERCRSCKKFCLKGSDEGYPCPWKLYPGGNDENTYCGLCFECLRTCKYDNIVLKLRMPFEELARKAVRVAKSGKFDETAMGYIRFGLAIFYELFFFGSLYWLKDFGNLGNPYGVNIENAHLLAPSIIGVLKWSIWAAIVLSAIVAIAALYYSFSYIAAKLTKLNPQKVFVALSYSLVPYGLFVWAGFAVGLLSYFYIYPFSAFFDPFGLEKNAFPTSLTAKQIILLQTPFIALALTSAIIAAKRIAEKITTKSTTVAVIYSIPHFLTALILIRIIAG
ncbi:MULTISPECIES: 4Fe-4S binding protein [unclassified Archaeoglobus]|jgi:polyferredoxin/plastocyanin|uniref:4Fe-4S binding protein n=1 Tax=unclassified Archaeoglobus TaxID=2643606 RepID=UPI0025BF41FD|nr:MULTISPECIES: 4Fe-4S binding protein [unclassified Archaeoglobus]